MNFNEYQEWTRTTAIYPKEIGRLYTTLGLAEESGEVAGKLKKAIRDGHDESVLRANVLKELGDVMWYAARVADEFGWKLDEVVDFNVGKLSDRKDRGVLQGSGDNR